MTHPETPNYRSKNIRTFIGAKDYGLSRKFYRELGFTEVVIDQKMCLFKVNNDNGFYLQDYYVKDWVNNSMVFLEVEDVDQCWQDLTNRGVVDRYKYVRLSAIKQFEWGRECFLHDPSGVLWHFCQFNA